MGMIPTQTLTTMFLLVFGVSSSIFIMLLPAIWELKKPKDAGPRKIMLETSIIHLKTGRTVLITDLEDYRFEQPYISKILDVIAILPNLEA